MIAFVIWRRVTELAEDTQMTDPGRSSLGENKSAAPPNNHFSYTTGDADSQIL